MRKYMNHYLKRFGLLSLFFIAPIAFAEESVDEDIVKNLDFFSQMEIIENMQIASNLNYLEEAND